MIPTTELTSIMSAVLVCLNDWRVAILVVGVVFVIRVIACLPMFRASKEVLESDKFNVPTLVIFGSGSFIVLKCIK